MLYSEGKYKRLRGKQVWLNGYIAKWLHCLIVTLLNGFIAKWLNCLMVSAYLISLTIQFYIPITM